MDNETAARHGACACALVAGAEKIIRGKRAFLETLVACVLARGHVLLEDRPGTGKTTAAKTFAALIGGEEALRFKRIQFTPDLLPYDITGVDVFDAESRSFRFMPGPILSNVVLADEINRTTPKVQAALLEAMAERQVTVGNTTHRPPEPFFVIATQNPIESEGTFPLPAAQLDRFMVKLSLGYPDRESELSLLNDAPAERELPSLKPLVSVEDFLALQVAAEGTFCHPLLKEAIVDIARETRTHRAFSLGASPRAALHLLALSKAFALVRRRAYVVDEDVALLAAPALAHRLRVRDAKSDAGDVVREIALERIGAIKSLS
jgi:MoxR-like ATPase